MSQITQEYPRYEKTKSGKPCPDCGKEMLKVVYFYRGFEDWNTIKRDEYLSCPPCEKEEADRELKRQIQDEWNYDHRGM